jgi:4-amino-4-deoxy-L-arabinose transferase-like glycosyltransferase
MSHLNYKVLSLCVATFILATAVAWGALGAMPHLEDEQANVFQAKVFASGRVTVDEPPVQPISFFIPFIIHFNGQAFGKYTPGYPLALSIGALIHQPWVVNALAAALTVLGVYLLGRDLFDRHVGLLAAALGAISPMFLLLSGTLLAHTTTMCALTFFAWTFVRARRSTEPHRVRFAIVSGVSIGWALITRPWTAVAVGTPFALIAFIDLVRSLRRNFRTSAAMLMAFIVIASIWPLYNFVTTGSPATNTYTLWWPYDTIGFGPNVGRGDDGHTWDKAMINFRLDFPLFGEALLGWPSVVGWSLSWLPVALGLVWPQLDKRDWALMIPPALLIVAHFAYWARGEGLFGPRYYAEGMPFVWVVAARGLIKFGATTWPRRSIKLALPVLFAWSIVFAIEPRFMQSFDLYRVERTGLDRIDASKLHHALVFVRTYLWTDYAGLAWQNAPQLNESDVLFAEDFGSLANTDVIDAFPGRTVYYYDKNQSIPLVAGR